jgi:hypothetical protein
MKFEDMQAIWKSQNSERRFAINEIALHTHIQQKRRTINNLVEVFEWTMIALNLIVGIALVFNLLRDNPPGSAFILPVVFFYFAYAAYALVQRLRRRAAETRFKPTLLGELDRAIWQIDYLIRQGRSLTLRYVLPLVLVVSITVFYSQKPAWVLAMALTLIPVSYFAPRWEINKWYLPKKRDLELLREKLSVQEIP